MDGTNCTTNDKYLSLSFQIQQSHNAAGKADLLLCVSFLSELVKSKTRKAHSYKKLENFKCRNKIGLFAMGFTDHSQKIFLV